MTELYFLRHGERIDHALQKDPEAKPILEDYKDYDPSLATSAVPQLQTAVDDICSLTKAFSDKESTQRKNVFIHFSPYLRCCQTADILITELKASFLERFPNYKVRFQLLGDFALSEWIHDKMKSKPPFVDSDDAYNMYTPNLKSLKNKNACSNFRPTVTLGPYNGPDLSYKDYQTRCKDYFQKLLATYNKPAYIRNQDIVIIVSHGYAINQFVTYFINHPLFEEIPEATVNFALRVLKEDVKEPKEPFDPFDYTWRLVQDALHLINEEDMDTTLNLETDIVYYQTNFIKKDDTPTTLKPEPENCKPRASFKIKETSASNPGGRVPVSAKGNHIVAAAKDWVPNAKHYKIKADFKEKIMNDEAFRKNFKITNHPSRPISPEVSPNSAPTRINSVIDLSKLMSNEDIQPMKLKYSNTSEIPIQKINSRMNSQVNLANYGNPSMGSKTGSMVDFKSFVGSQNSSKDNSSTDLPKYISSLQNRSRSSSNPLMMNVAHNADDSYFPSHIVGRMKSPESDVSVDGSISEQDEQLGSISEDNEPHSSEPKGLFDAMVGRNSPIDSLNRARSLNKRRTNSPLFVAQQLRKLQSLLFQNSFTQLSKGDHDSLQKPFGDKKANSRKDNNKNNSSNSSDDDDDDDDDDEGRMFSLSFSSSMKKPEEKTANSNSNSNSNRPRKDSFKLYTSSPPPKEKAKGSSTRPVFYNFNSSGESSSDDSDDSNDDKNKTKQNPQYTPNRDENGTKKTDYFWFGQNR
ncbi:Ubiquitin-associated and SH3 domain-containing protein A [Candida viswanathii]|uniref:Ubiquitin-associated and SH3 domain-containing protein A n=1 Tax=Candida viswanathii TaxID=5486 RepID=A0A367XQH4_9ASCO|nr:Ubiquitin-associated and SH3 domain-containing protein A [Candida viswanathii]